jgi:hypothetical protein
VAKSTAEKMAILEAEIDKLKKKEKQRAKSEEERKKYVVGDFVLRVMKKDNINACGLIYNSQSFEKWLDTKSDRDLFGFLD